MAHGRTYMYMDMDMHMHMYMCMLYMCMSIAAVAAKPRSLPADAGVSVRRHMLDISVRRQVQYEDNKSSSERCWESRWRAACCVVGSGSGVRRMPRKVRFCNCNTLKP